MKKQLATTLLLSIPLALSAQNKQPNVVVIFADDLGFGDVSCYNKDSKIITPNIDALAQNGIRFVDAHSPSSISSPSRYSLLTGCYSWRTTRKRGNPRTSEEIWIEPGRETIADVLNNQGYNCAAIGKWGLGANWNSVSKPGRKGEDISPDAVDLTKWLPGAQRIGFTYEAIHRWFDNVADEKDGSSSPKTKGHKLIPYENGYIQSGRNSEFDEFDMEKASMHYIYKTVEYIEACGGLTKNKNFNIKKDAPFFIYYTPHIPHTPHVPAPQFIGTSGVGLYGDYVLELDWAVGQIVGALERIGELDNTMIIFASDNGPEIQTFDYIANYDHRSMGDLRGIKRDVYQGGHTTPFIVSYAPSNKKGVVSDRLVSLTDIYKTVADLIDVDVDRKFAEDSYSFIDELLPEKRVAKHRNMAIHHGYKGELALRYDNWVFIYNESGSSRGEPEWFKEELGVESVEGAPYELFDLSTDPRQIHNLVYEHPEIVDKMRTMLFDYIFWGRTN